MNEQDIENLIFDYHWKFNEIKRLEAKQEETGIHKFQEEMNAKQLCIYKKDIETIISFYDYLEDDKKIVIFDCMMEGMSYRSIADHLGVSRTKIGEMKNEMLNQLCLCEKSNMPRQST